MSQEKNAFQEYRTDVSYDSNKENYYVDNNFDVVKGYSSFASFYKDSKKCLRFRKSYDVQFQPVTLVKSENIEYTITDKKNRQKIVVAVTVIDNNNPNFILPFVNDPSKPETKNLPVKGMTYYIEKSYLNSVNPERPDPPQSKILINPLKGIESAVDLWYKNANGTILEDDRSYYVVLDSPKTKWKDDQEKRILEEEIKKLAVEYFLLHYEVKETGVAGLSTEDILLQSASAPSFYASNRKKSKLKSLTSIPKQMTPLREDDPATSSVEAYVLEGLTLRDLKKYLRTVKNYFLSLNPVVKKENINLNLSKEAENIDLALKSILQVFKFNKTRKAEDTDSIRITWSPTFNITNLQIIVKKFKTESVQEGTIGTKGDPLEGEVFNIPVKSKFTHKIFKNPRTMLFLINIDLMASEIINKSISGTNKIKWFEFLNTYVHKMPEYHPSATKLSFMDEIKSAKNTLLDVQRLLTQGSTLEAKQQAMMSLTPLVKASIGEMQRNVFEKIEDPTLKLIIENIDQINSLDSLYDMVLTKFPPSSLLSMARSGLESKGHNTRFFESLEDTEINLPSLELSDAALKNFSIDSASDKDSLLEDYSISADKILDQFKLNLFTDEEEIFDITEGEVEKTFSEVHDMISQGLVDVFKKILLAVKKNLIGESPKQIAEKIGTLDVEETLEGNQFQAIKSKINSFPNVYLEDRDLSEILKIISDLATPQEILSIFEGTGDSEVIDIIGTEIVLRFSMLEQTLDTIYSKEEFLMTIGEVLLSNITIAVGNQALEDQKEEDMEEISSFCSPETIDEAADHLSGRFPEEFVQKMMREEEGSNRSIATLLDRMEEAIQSDDLAGFLFGGKINDLINSMSQNSRTSNLAKDMTIESFFDPIVSVFDVESLNVGEFFISTAVVPDLSDSPLDPAISMQINALKTEAALKEEGSDAREALLSKAEAIEEKANSQKKKLSIVLNDEVLSLQENLKKGPVKVLNQDKKLICNVGDSLRHVELTYSTIPNNVEPANIDPTKSAMNQAEAEAKAKAAPEAGEIQAGDMRLRAYTVSDQEEKILIDNASIINYPKLGIKELIKSEDVGISAQCSAYASFVKKILNERIDFYKDGFFPNEEDEPTVEDLDKVIQDVKDYLYHLTSTELGNFISLSASKSSFFDISNIKKLKFSPTDGDTREAPLLCDQVESEEGNKLQTEEDELIPQILLIGEILDRTRERETYFSILEREERQKIFGRSAMENALIMELTEIFFKTIVLEFLISGIFIFGEVNCESLLKDKNNFKIIQENIFSTMENLGHAFKNNFSTYLTQYASIRQDIEADEEAASVLPMPQSINVEDLDSVVNFILLEQMEKIYDNFQKSIHAVSANQNLEVHEVLDLIPNIDVAESSRSIDHRFLMSEELQRIKKHGGFVLEKYIKTSYSPSVEINSLSDFLISRKDKIKIPSYDSLTGEFEWIYYSGDKGAVLSKLLNDFLQDNADYKSQFIKDIKAAQSSGDMSYEEYFKKTGKFGTPQLNQLKSEKEIFDIMMGKAEALGSEFLKTLPGYTDYISQINKFSVSLEGEEFLYTYPNYLGVVNLNSFKEMQEYIHYNINKPYADKIDSAKEVYETLVDKKAVIQTYDAQLDKFYQEWGALEIILDEDIKKYSDKFKSSISLKDPFDDSSIVHDPSDNLIFDWVSGTKEKLLGLKRESITTKLFQFYHDEQLIDKDAKLKKFAEDYGTTVSYVDESILGDIKISDYKEAIGAYLQSISEEDLMDFLSNLEYAGFIAASGREAYNKLTEQLKTMVIDVKDYFMPTILSRILYIQTIIARGYTGEPDDSIKAILVPEDIKELEEEWEGLQERYDMLKSFNLAKQLENFQMVENKIKDKQQDIDLLLDNQFPFDMEKFFKSEIAAAKELEDSAKYYQEKFSVYGPHTKYFEPLKYGIRLCYVYPDVEDIGAAELLGFKEIEESQKISSRFNKIAGSASDSHNYSNKILRTESFTRVRKESSDGNWWSGELVTPAKYEKNTINMIPLIEIEDEVDNYFPKIEQEGELNIPSDNRDFDQGRKTFTGISLTSDKIISEFPLKQLKSKMINTSQFKSLFSEMFIYGDITSALGIYSSMHVIEEMYKRQSLGIFSGTKIYVKSMFNNIINPSDFISDTEIEPQNNVMKNNFVGMSNPTGNPSLEEGFQPGSYGYAAAFAKKTGLIILKHFVEKTDPAIIRGKQIQKHIIEAAKLTENAIGSISEALNPEEQEKASQGNTAISDTAKLAANQGMLLPIVMFGVRPFPPIPFPVGDPTAPLTPAGMAYLALTATGGFDSLYEETPTSQQAVEQENETKNCIDK